MRLNLVSEEMELKKKENEDIENRTLSKTGIITKKTLSLKKSDAIDHNKYAMIRNLTQQKNPNSPTGKQSYFINKYAESFYYKKFQQYQKIIYLILEEPMSSRMGQAFFIIMVVCIAFTTINEIFESRNFSFYESDEFTKIIEFAAYMFFIFEFGFRLISSTAFGEEFLRFIKKPIIIVDLITIIPFMLENAIDLESLDSIKLVKFIHLLRMITILKLTRYIKGANIFWEGIMSSLESFGFLLLTLIVGNLLFAVCFYYIEYDPIEIAAGNTSIVVSIPDSMWWALVTMTTIGYGDKYAHTDAGKVICGITALTGMLMIALPVAILGINFQQAYDIDKEARKINALKKAISNAHPNETEDKKENIFVNERIKALGDGSAAIRKLLTKSDDLYSNVENEIKILYSALYEEEKKEEEEESSRLGEINLFGMNRIIKIKERLTRAKRKIKLMTLFHKPIGIDDYKNTDSHRINDIGESSNLLCTSERTSDNNRGKLTKPRNLTTMPYKIKEEEETSERSPCKMFNFKNSIPGKGVEILGNKKSNPLLLQKITDDPEVLLMTSDEEETHNKDINSYSHKPRQSIFMAEKDRKIQSAKAQQEKKLFIKANSVDNENSFIKYKNDYLDFLSNNMLDELLKCDSEPEFASFMAKNGSKQMILGPRPTKNKSPLSRTNIIGHEISNQTSFSHISGNLVYSRKTTKNQQNNKEAKQRNSKQLDINVDTNSKTWQLAEKIFKDQLEKQSNKRNNDKKYTRNISDGVVLKSKGFHSYMDEFLHPFEDYLGHNHQDEIDLTTKHRVRMNSPKQNKLPLRLKSSKILDEEEDDDDIEMSLGSNEESDLKFKYYMVHNNDLKKKNNVNNRKHRKNVSHSKPTFIKIIPE